MKLKLESAKTQTSTTTTPTPAPAQYSPVEPAQFIGPAAEVADILTYKAAILRQNRNCTCKILLYGPPGVGKSKLAEMLAMQLASTTACIESYAARNVDIPTVRNWQIAGRYRPLFGCFDVKIVNDLDDRQTGATDILLTYLDEMPQCTAFIATSNQNPCQLDFRLQSRLQQFEVGPPSTKQIVALLKRMGLSPYLASRTAVGCGGDVRAALLGAQSILDAQLLWHKRRSGHCRSLSRLLRQ